MQHPPAIHPPDAELRREFTLWSAAAVAFAFISPIVALYSIFGLVLKSAGPAGWWAFPIVFAGQILVVLSFAELSSRWPFEGSVYQWARRLAPRAVGWMTGWTYAWTLIISTAAVSYSAAIFVGPTLGLEIVDPVALLLVALAILAVVTFLNSAGRRWLKYLVAGALVAELVGSVLIAAYLLIFQRSQSFDVLFQNFSAGEVSPGYLWSGFGAAVAFVGWSFVGFEAASSIAEEVKGPARAVPKAMIMSLVMVATVVTFSALSIILATPDMQAAVSGGSADPVVETILARLGADMARPLFALFVIAFIATLAAVQASASRMIFALARDKALPGAGILSKLSPKDGLPVAAISAVGIAGALVLLTTAWGDVYATLIGFTVGGFFITFSIVMVCRMIAQLRGRWTAGPFSLGNASAPVMIIATLWAVFEAVNIGWPRAVDQPWYIQYAIPLMFSVLLIAGTIIYFTIRHRIVPPAPEPATSEDLALADQ
ncbi:APC family permease [Paenarthrobacter sp. NPDC089714]|uniref:APC family permease n=1 Tax=Paenarthrobacter sp. NPDC089714 TaxID=3364377 RepID=UPI00382A374C